MTDEQRAPGASVVCFNCRQPEPDVQRVRIGNGRGGGTMADFCRDCRRKLRMRVRQEDRR